MIPLRTGNLGVLRLEAVRRGAPVPDPAEELAQIAEWRALGFDGVEDYVAWAAVEPVPGRPDFTAHRAYARETRRLGMQYVIYPWAHAWPAWARRSSRFVPSRCLQHDRAGSLPSLFAEPTWSALEAFYRAVADALGDVVDGVVAAFPADYGEVGFPCGMAHALVSGADPVELDHHHAGLWCGEPEARARFAAEVRARHGTPRQLGAAWSLPADDAWAHCPYPARTAAHATLVHRRDFADFLRGAVTRLAARQAALVRELFPHVPRELKLGHCSEALELGTDWHALVALAAEARATVRFTGAGMDEIFTRRVASLCRTHGATFATEAPREIETRHLKERQFRDLAAGASALFEFPEQWRAVEAQSAALREAFGRAVLPVPLACAYPTLDLSLAEGHGAPPTLVHCWSAFRRVANWVPLDEEQIARGALHGIAGLLWLEGDHVPAPALAALSAWVRAGGVLICGCERAPSTFTTQASGAEGDDDLSALRRAMRPATALRCRWPRDGTPVVLLPGEDEARVFLGPGWHGREDGAFAFPGLAERVPCRWAGERAELLLPRPDAEDLELRVDLFLPPRAPLSPLRVYVDGLLCGEFSVRGRQELCVSVPPAREEAQSASRTAGTMVRVQLVADTHRPEAHGDSTDRRDLGPLVRRIALLPRGAAEDAAGDLRSPGAPPPSLRCVSPDAAERLGAGLVLRGNGTPLSALAFLNTWLAGEIAGSAPPDPPRDALQRCHVAALEGGLLVHNPDAHAAAAPRLTGAGVPASLRAPAPLQPLQTVWLPLSGPG